LKILAVADSDSYLKWAATLLDQLPPEWDRRLVVVRTPITPSAGQIRAAVSGSGAAAVPTVSAGALNRILREYDPDAVLLSCTGPVVRALTDLVSADRRRVLLSGLPGISVPASEKAWRFRSGADLFVVHSDREVADFRAIAGRLGIPGAVARATLPFLAPSPRVAAPDRVVFATQAKVPMLRAERELILLSLAELAGRRPDLSVVVKLRARADEQQTHRELLHYETLWKAMRVDHTLLTFDAGPMRDHLAHAVGFVTVSSTAALEAIAAGVPLLILEDFGVNAEMINLVFEGSGLLGTLDDLAEAEFRTPSGPWCAANYFHDASADDWISRLTALAGAELPPARRALENPWIRARARLRFANPVLYKTLVAVRNLR
jgi:hypothetical protein